MSITINGNGTISGYEPVANGSITAAKLASGAISAASLPAGSILQVGNTNTSSPTDTITLSSNGTFYGWAALDTTITTLSANSKLLISCQVFGEASANDILIGFAWQRGISGTFTDFILGDNSSSSRRAVTAMMGAAGRDTDDASTPSCTVLPPLIDAPSQAAGTAITYRIGISKQSGSVGYFYTNRSNGTNNDASYERGVSWMTVMEIKA